jgi:TonB family protein
MRVKNPTLLPLLLISFALTPATFAADQPIFAADDPPPGAIDPGFDSPPWPDEADAQGTASGSPLDRWTRQADAGRARAAAIMGRYWLERVPENPENCAKAIEWFTKADKLGSNEAPTWLGHLFRRFDCPQRNVATAIEWLKKAVPLMSFGAAADLSSLHAATDTPGRDPVMALAYGRVAAQSSEFPADDPESPGRLAALEQGLDARQIKAAGELADKLLATIGQRRATLTAPPRAENLKPVAKGSGWAVSLMAYDALRECTANIAGNCKGVRRLAYFQAVNQGSEYLRCKLALDHRDFSVGEKSTNERETLLPPRATRRLYLGKVGEVGGNEDLRVSCQPVTALAANVAAGKCRVTTTGVPSVSDFYPPGSRRRNEEGRVVVNVLLDKKEGQPALVELKDSSGFPELDVAGVKMGTYMAFKGDCDVGYSSVAIAFRLQD